MGLFGGLDKLLGLGFGDTESEQRGLFQSGLQETRSAQARAGQMDARALQALIQGFSDSRGALRAGAESARTAAGRGAAGMQGRASLNAFNRGLVGTSAGTAITSAADRRGTEATNGIEAQLAALESQLFAQEGQAIAQQRGNMASRTMQGGRDLAELFGSVQIDNQGGALLNGLFGLGGAWLGGRNGGKK